MLVLSRQPGESVKQELNGVEMIVTVVSVRGNKVRLGFSAPKEVAISRVKEEPREEPVDVITECG